MPTLKQIRRRIRSVRSTMQITRAMEMVAATKLRRAQASAEAARPYAAALEETLTRLAGAARSRAHPLFEVREPRRTLLAVVASDKGLCGTFNVNVIHRAEKRAAELGAGGWVPLPIGLRVLRHMERTERSGVEPIAHLGDSVGTEMARTLAQGLITRFTAREFDRIEFVYTRFVSMTRREVVCRTVLPVAPLTAQAVEIPYLFEPNADEVLGVLLPRYVTMRVFAILAESLAAEHAARMFAMGNATRNADELIGDLTLGANKLRQATITRELIEIVSGAAGVE